MTMEDEIRSGSEAAEQVGPAVAGGTEPDQVSVSESENALIEEAQEGPPEEPAAAHGPPDKTEADFAHIEHPTVRLKAFREYQRTLEEFRRDGRATMLKEGAFNHLAAPWNFKFDVYKAHRTALADIARWQREERHKEKEKLAAEQREAARREQQAAVLESIRRRKQELEAAAQREEAETKRRAASQPVVRAVVPEEPPPPPLPKVRGVEFDARAPSKLCSCEEDGPLLELERPEAPPLPPDAETEALLREMIGECHFLMREVAFRSMCQARVLEDRRDWVETSMKLAKTGATVAKAIGKLRHGPSAREVHHFNTVTKVIAAAQGVGGSANP